MFIIVGRLEGTNYVDHKIEDENYKLKKHERIVAKGTKEALENLMPKTNKNKKLNQ